MAGEIPAIKAYRTQTAPLVPGFGRAHLRDRSTLVFMLERPQGPDEPIQQIAAPLAEPASAADQRHNQALGWDVAPRLAAHGTEPIGPILRRVLARLRHGPPVDSANEICSDLSRNACRVGPQARDRSERRNARLSASSPANGECPVRNGLHGFDGGLHGLPAILAGLRQGKSWFRLTRP